jgi:hypothetical protein
MRPIDQYATIRKGQVELQQQAENERITKATSLRKLMNSNLRRNFACWLGSRLVTLGGKLKQLGTPRQPSPSPHH